MAKKKTIIEVLNTSTNIKAPTKAPKKVKKRKKTPSKSVKNAQQGLKKVAVGIGKKKTISKAKREKLNKIRQLERSIKKGKNFHYGKLKFKSLESAKRYLERIKVKDKIKGDEKALEAYKEIQKINKKLRSKIKSEEQKNLKDIFKKEIEIPTGLSPDKIKLRILEQYERSKRVSSHEIFARVQSVFSMLNSAIDSYKIAQAFDNIMNLPITTSEDSEKLQKLLEKFYDILNSESDDLEYDIINAIDDFLAYYIEKHPEESDNIDILTIKEELHLEVAETE